MKKKLYILLVLCLASAILVGCIAADASKPKGGELSGESVIEGLNETVSDEVSEDDAGSGEMTESVASKGEPNDEPSEDEPSKDEPSDEPIEDELPKDEPSDEPIEDEPSEDEPMENTAHDWDAQKGWPLYVGEYVDTGEEWLWPYGDGYWFNTAGALTAIGEELLYHVRIPAYRLDTNEGDFDKMIVLVQSLNIPFETVANDRGTEDIHFNLSRSDAIRFTEYMTEAGFEPITDNMYQQQVIHICFCGDHLGAERTASPQIPENWATLAWDLFRQSEDYWKLINTAYDWDAQKGWPVFVFRDEDMEQFRLRTWPAVEFPYGSAEWNYVAKAFDGEEILIHAKLFADEKQKAFIQYLGIPYETVASDADYVHLDLSYADAVKLIDLMYKAGLCMEDHPNMFRLCYCDDLNNKTNTVSPKLPEDEPITNTAYDWDFQKGWPVFMFREEDLNTFLTWAWPEWLTPYGDPQWEYVVKTFKGEELLFHVSTIERDGKTEELLQSLEIPYQSCKEDGIKKLHLNLSYADTVKLVGLMYQAGLVESEDAMVFYLCLCGDPCGETNVVSPELTYRF